MFSLMIVIKAFQSQNFLNVIAARLLRLCKTQRSLYFLMTLLGMVESLKGWLPTRLMECISLVSGGTEEYAKAAVVAAVCAVLMFVGALIISRRRV